MAVLKGKVNGEWKEITSSTFQYNGAFAGITVIVSSAEPANPAEQTVWVKSDVTDIPKWTIQADEPASPAEGQVWLAETHLAKVELIAMTQTNEVHCAIAQARQYVSGAWVWCECKIYAGGEWKDTGVYWFKAGEGYNSTVFGALYLHEYASVDAANGYIAFAESPNTYPKCSSQNLITAGRYKYLCVDAEFNTTVSDKYLTIGTAPNYATSEFTLSQKIYNQNRAATVIDISGASEDFYLKLMLLSQSTGKIYNVWLM